LSKTILNKAIINYTSPALCTPISPFPPTGDAAYHQRAGGGPSHGHGQHAQKIWHVVPEVCSRTHKHRQTYSSQYLATAPVGEVIIIINIIKC